MLAGINDKCTPRSSHSYVYSQNLKLSPHLELYHVEASFTNAGKFVERQLQTKEPNTAQVCVVWVSNVASRKHAVGNKHHQEF